MKALVTGSAGFVGRHMVRALEGRGYEVLGMDVHNKPSRDMLIHMPTGDFDLVVHCAYIVGGRKHINESKYALAYNLKMDAELFLWASSFMPARVLYYSSSAAYPTRFQGPNDGQALHETMIADYLGIKPDADYGWAKLTGERLARNYADSGGVVHVVRPFSGYGSDQSLDYPFPKFVERAKDRQSPFEVWGDPTSVRDWVHIDDVVGASLAVIDADYREPVNICTGRDMTFGGLAVMMMAEAGYSAPIKAIDGPQGVHTRVGDPTAMLKLYRPKVSLEEGVRRAFA